MTPADPEATGAPNDPAGYQSGLTNALCFGIAP